MKRLGHFIQHHATIILFVIVIGALGLAYNRQGQLIRQNHELSVKTQELTVELEATVKQHQLLEQQRRVDLCAAEEETRTAVKNLLLSLSDFVGPVRQVALELRIHEALDPKPDNCP